MLRDHSEIALFRCRGMSLRTVPRGQESDFALRVLLVDSSETWVDVPTQVSVGAPVARGDVHPCAIGGVT